MNATDDAIEPIDTSFTVYLEAKVVLTNESNSATTI